MRSVCFFAFFILTSFLTACSSESDEITTAVPPGYGVAAKVESMDWQKKAMAALAIAEATAAEPPAVVEQKGSPSFVIKLPQPKHLKRAKGKGRQKTPRTVALARRK